ncbi:MAG: DUF2911 domain-containing protein [Sphingobacteriaceae bacterium]
MKKLLLLTIISGALFSGLTASAQDEDKSKRPSPPATVTETTSTGLTIKIDYSQPAVKGRTIGKDIAPYGEVWRTGANEATVFEINKAAKIEGKSLAAGKYSLYSIPGEKEWTIIFGKNWKEWGTEHKDNEDVLRVMVKPSKAPATTERMTFKIDKKGKVTLMWGDVQVNFTAK